jgi:cytochrome c peroxidase
MRVTHYFNAELPATPGRSLALILAAAAMIAAVNWSLAPQTLAARVQTMQRRPQLLEPELPATPFVYNDAAATSQRNVQRLLALGAAARGAGSTADNTPTNNPITDHGATLGRVLFYDTRLSANNTTSCGSCHMQEFGFSDTARFSVGLNGERTKRHSMALGNARFYSSGRFFWDERAATLEEQVLMPIQDKVEMGMTLGELTAKLQQTKFYPALFDSAFGSPQVSSERISLALAQFIRAMISTPRPGGAVALLAARVTSVAVAPANPPGTTSVRLEPQGPLLFQQQCATCHIQTTHSIDAPHNTGQDSATTDEGAGGGKFKAPSLRNVAVRGPYMHDGRFKTLAEVVEFYNSGIQNNPNLVRMFRRADGSPDRMNLTESQKAALVQYMQTFTDPAFLSDPRFSDPFQREE